MNPKTGHWSKVDQPATWTPRKLAQKRADKFDDASIRGVGLMLGETGAPEGWTLGGVDLDGCRDPETGAVAPWAEKVVRRLGSYSEASPSGTGLHVLFLAKTADVAALRRSDLMERWGRSFSKDGHREIGVFFGRKFLTVTDQRHGNATRICPVSRKKLAWLLLDHGPSWASNDDASPDQDTSGSGYAWRLALRLFRQGKSREEVAEALSEDDSEAGEWWARVDQRQHDRVLDGTERAASRVDPSDFDDLDEETRDLLGVESKPGTLGFLTPSQCADADPRQYVVKHLIAQGDVGCIVGAPGVGKSVLAPSLAYAVAQGREAHGKRTKPGRVFYVAAEDEHGMKGRITALRNKHGDTDEFVLVTGVSDLLSEDVAGKGSRHFRALSKAVKSQKPALIVVDTLAMAFPGLEENSAEGMGRVVAVARALTKWGAAVVLVHHDTKEGGGLPRGHSLLNGALDVSIHLQANQDGIVRGRLTKNRNGGCDVDLAFRVRGAEVGVDQDGDVMTAAICDPCDATEASKEPKLKPSERAALHLIFEMMGDDNEVSESEWRDAAIDGRAVSGSDDRDNRRRTISAALAGLERAGQIRVENGWIKSVSIGATAEDFDDIDGGEYDAD